jgi:hypothetical protein
VSQFLRHRRSLGKRTSVKEIWMRHPLLLSAALLAGLTATAAAQKPAAGIKLADVAGTWDEKTMVGPKDSVVATAVLVATADGKGWTMTFPKHPPVAVRVVSLGGDSVVTEAGPYPSVLRPGQTVTLLHMVGHFKGSQMSGTFEADYSGGDKVKGKMTGTRKH